MKAYLAVIKDSFREALSSRVLWILLILTTLLLLALAPLGIREELASTLHRRDIRAGVEFAQKLSAQGTAAKLTPGRTIWPMLSEDLQSDIEQLNAAQAPSDEDDSPINEFELMSRLISELNALLDRADFYNEEAWKGYSLNDEAAQLQERGIDNLSGKELRRLNRLALQAAYSTDIVKAPNSAGQLVYFGYELGDPLPMDRDQTQQGVKNVLMIVMSFLVGAIGVFVAILVSASIIPQTFEPGSIDLLLSKPLSRSLLFLTKFVGGCAFILLNAAYLIVGLWLYLGLRFDIWSNRLLLCIPVFLFLFSIYYSVSAFAGVVWRNAVVCVVMAILFWAACFVVGTTKGAIESFALNSKRFAVIVPAGDTLLGANKSGDVFQWQPRANGWRQVFQGQQGGHVPFGFAYPMVGPVYDAQADQLVAISSVTPGFPTFGGAGKLAVGKRDEDWRRVTGVTSPHGTQSVLINSDGRILTAGTSGLFRFEGDPTYEHKPWLLFGLDFADKKKVGKFVTIGPAKGQSWSQPFSAGYDAQSDTFAVYSRGKLAVLEHLPEGRFEVAQETETPEDGAALIATTGEKVILAAKSGEVLLFEADTLKQTGSYRPFGKNEPRLISTSPDGRWIAVLFHNRKLSLYDAENNREVDAGLLGQGDISTAAFNEAGQLLAADRFPRVTAYEPGSWEIAEQYEAPSETLELVYRYVVKPIYTVFPKPGELDNVVAYLLLEQKSAAVVGDQEDNLQAERAPIDIWTPIWSNLAFLAVMLGLTCLYIERKDF